MKSALYPGTFDPITNGHLDLIRRSLALFDKLYVAVLRNPLKDTLFSVEERLVLIRHCVSDLERIEVRQFEGLTVAFAQKLGVTALVRGVRLFSDFEYEFQMALTNRKLAAEIETIFLMPSEKYSYVSSSLVKDIVRHGGDISCFVPSFVEGALKEKFGRSG